MYLSPSTDNSHALRLSSPTHLHIVLSPLPFDSPAHHSRRHTKWSVDRWIAGGFGSLTMCDGLEGANERAGRGIQGRGLITIRGFLT
jgi:hypothetical protein